jgi:hypothetical protein
MIGLEGVVVQESAGTWSISTRKNQIKGIFLLLKLAR